MTLLYAGSIVTSSPKNSSAWIRTGSLGLLALPVASWAHPGAEYHIGFLAGLLHPLQGADHMLALVALSCWAVQQGGRALWLLPVLFISGIAGGALAAQAGFYLPAIEPLVLASVFVLGVCVQTAWRAPLWAQAALVTAFAGYHGQAHGVSTLPLASSLPYLTGILLASAGVLGLTTLSVQHLIAISKKSLSILGAAIAASGLYLALT